MSPITVTVNADVARKLQEAGQPVDLCDPTGRIVGKFVPLVDLSKWEPVTPEVSDEEIQRRFNSDERRYTTAEVLEHLRKL